MSSRREGLRGEMKLEDHPWMGSHYDITGNFLPAVSVELGVVELECNDWEVRKDGVPTPFFQGTQL